MKRVLHILFVVFLANVAQSQHCHTDEVHAQMLEQNPELASSYAGFDSLALAFSNREVDIQMPRHVVEIPVVVHVLYFNEEQNISDRQIHSQIQALNRDFNMDTNDWASNPEPFRWLAENSGIRFVLADRDPEGNPSNGIVRKQVGVRQIGTTEKYYKNARGGSNPWPRAHYLNVWVGETNDSILGFAIYPYLPIGEKDGIFMNYKVFGTTGTATPPFNDGRTMVHEVGHYFGLRHPWSNDDDCDTDDYIDDTPRQLEPNYTCQSFPKFSCPGEPNGDMYMNYMDYASDVCINMFTRRQVEYMHLVLSTVRSSLFDSPGLTGTKEVNAPDLLSIYPNPASGFVTLEARESMSVELLDIHGRIIRNLSLKAGQNRVEVANLNSGVYFIRFNNEVKRLVIH